MNLEREESISAESQIHKEPSREAEVQMQSYETLKSLKRKKNTMAWDL